MTRRSAVLLTTVLTAVLLATTLLTACGGGDDSTSAGHDRDTSSDAPPTSLAPGRESDYLGLTEAQAMKKAREQGRPARVVRKDDEVFPATLDYNPDRVSFEIDDGKVTKATFG